MITRDDWIAYEEIRSSGVTNMWDVKLVCELSGLDKEQAMEIMKNYSKLKEQFAISGNDGGEE